MWRSLFFILLILKSVKSEYQAYSVALGQTKPTIATNPDLSVLTESDFPCFSIKDNIACPGYDFYIPQSGYYGYDKKASSDFSTYVNIELANDSGYIMATCPGVTHDVSKIAYRYSVYCGRMMYAQVRWCKQNPENYRRNASLMLCRRTCLEYAQSIVDYGQSVCGDSTVAQKISSNIIDKWCNLFSDEEGCIEGITTEVENCGYTSASRSSEAYTFNPNNACWKQPEKVEEIKEKATKEENTEVKMGTIKWKVLYPVIIMILVGMVTYFCYKKQEEAYLTGYTNIVDTEQDYEIIPSDVKPSRDYIDPNELEFPENTLPRNSSYKVSTLTRTNRLNEDRSSVLYMIAIYNYHARMDDELELKAGDRIRVEHQYNDG